MEESALVFTDFASYCLTYGTFFPYKIPWLFLDFCLFFKFPWPISKFPDFSLTVKKIHFSLTSLTVGTLTKGNIGPAHPLVKVNIWAKI